MDIPGRLSPPPTQVRDSAGWAKLIAERDSLVAQNKQLWSLVEKQKVAISALKEERQVWIKKLKENDVSKLQSKTLQVHRRSNSIPKEGINEGFTVQKGTYVKSSYIAFVFHIKCK
jgi:hypothetical protein